MAVYGDDGDPSGTQIERRGTHKNNLLNLEFRERLYFNIINVKD